MNQRRNVSVGPKSIGKTYFTNPAEIHSLNTEIKVPVLQFSKIPNIPPLLLEQCLHQAPVAGAVNSPLLLEQ
jgi:hypothetical protein